MNERIRQLARKAGEYVNEVYTPPVRSKTPGKIWEDGHIDWHTQFNQKFAELIVRECGQVVSVEIEENCRPSDDWGRDDWEQGYVSGMLAATRFMKAHFGIEEWS